MTDTPQAPGKRARSAEDKIRRRQSLIDAARRRLAVGGFDSFTMADLAREARVAKGTAYLYFETKEELLLDVLREDLALVFTRLGDGLDAGHAGDAAEQAARAVAGALLCVPGLLGLLQQLHTRFERNVSVAALREFKLFLLDGMTRAGQTLEQRLTLPPGKGLVLLMRAYAMAIGFAQMAEVSPELATVFRETPELSVLAIDFERDYVAALTELVRAHQKAG